MVPIGRTISLGLFLAALGLGAASGQPPPKDKAAAQRVESAQPPDEPKTTAGGHARPANARIATEKPPAPEHEADTPKPKGGEGFPLGTFADWVIVIFTGALTWVAFKQHQLETGLAKDAELQRADVKASIAEATRAATAMEIMAQAGQQSAEAAAKHVAISDDAARKQLRAYVGAQAINYTFNRETGTFAVSAEIKNFGQTPAFNFKLLGGLNYIDFPIKDPPEIAPLFGESHTLFPTMLTYVTSSLPADEERIQHLRSGRGGFLFTVRLEYTDHQGIRHEETIRSYATGKPPLNRFGETHTATMTFWRGEST